MIVAAIANRIEALKGRIDTAGVNWIIKIPYRRPGARAVCIDRFATVADVIESFQKNGG